MEALEQRINQRIYLLFFISLFLNVVFLFTHLGSSSSKTDDGYTRELAVSKAVLKVTRQVYQERLITYRHRVDSLTKQLQKQHNAAIVTRTRTQYIKEQMKEVEKGLSAQELLDRAAKLKISETFADAGRELDTKDSLLETQAIVYDNLLAEKDSMIQTCDTAFHVLSRQLEKQVLVNDDLVKSNTQLSKDLKKQERKAKRRRFFNRVLVTGGMILAGTLILAH